MNNPTLAASSSDDDAPKANPWDSLQYFAAFGGKHAPPDKLKIAGDAMPEDLELEKKATTDAMQLLADYDKIQERDRTAQAELLVPLVLQLRTSLRGEFSVRLRGAVALTLILHHGQYKDLLDDAKKPVFANERACIDSFATACGWSDGRQEISRLIRTAGLWILIVRAKLPAPPVLSRLKRLVTLPSDDTALLVYRKLVEVAGGKVPSLAAIEEAVDRWKKPESKRADGRAWMDKLVTKLTQGCGLLQPVQSMDPKIAEALTYCRAALEIATARMQAAKEKGDAEKSKPPPWGAPTKPCPLTLEQEGNWLLLDLRRCNAGIRADIEHIAPKLRWAKINEHLWYLELPQGPDAASAKKFHMREWLTRVLELMDCQPPPALDAA